MKTLLTNTITLAKGILAAIFILTFSACSKILPNCEKWEVEDVGTAINTPGCGIIVWDCGQKTLQLSFCGEALKDAIAGHTILLGEYDCCRKTRTFKRRIR